MKAILVIDYASEEDIGEKTPIHLINKKNKWYEEVVIKPMPKKKNEEIVIKGHTGEIAEAYQDGWNACIEELEK